MCIRDRTRSATGLPNIANFTKKVGVFMSSGTDRYLMDEDIAELQTYYGAVSSTYGSYAANKTDGLTKLLKLLGENKLEVLRDKLLTLDFPGLTKLTALQLSPMDEISSGLLSVSSDMEGAEPSIIVTTDAEPQDFLYFEDEAPPRYETVNTNEDE